jgi:hypothetical protein
MEKFLIMESGYKWVNPKIRKVAKWTKLDKGGYVDKVDK